ncbi:MAG: mechanosensitive ion channel family protein [Chitinophagaceae bacterium]|nr:mechanosensitive ion channel family protein [Oligoflexus sp.]
MFARFLSTLLLLTGTLTTSAAFSSAPGFLSPTKVETKEVENKESPRFMMKRFVEILNNSDVDTAFPYVEFPKGTGLEERRVLIEDLIEVLNKRGNIDIALISNNPAGNTNDNPDPNIEKIGTITGEGNNLAVTLRYSEDKSRKGWRFSSDFMERIPDIAAALHNNGFENKLPPQLVKHEVFGIKAWQALGLILIIAISVLAAMIIAYILYFLMKVLARKILHVTVPSQIFMGFMTPLRLFAGLSLFRSLVLYLDTDLEFRQNLAYFEAIVLTISFCIFSLRITAAGLELWRLSYERQGKHNATAMLVPLQKLITVLIFVLGAISLMRNLGFDVTAIIAGLGIGGVAIALAGQKTVENLFGGISIIMDQPVRVGDFGKFGDTMGTIEDIGLRSTKVRTLDRTLVSIPNAEFSHMTLENFEKRDKFKWAAQLGVRQDTTSDQMRFLLMQIKELMLSHPMVYNEPARVRFTAFGDSALTIGLFAYIRASNNEENLAIVEDLNLRVLDIIRDAGTDLAYPSQTLYLQRSGGVTAEKITKAEEKIAAIRSTTGFPQPHYPASWAESRVDTLEFPDIDELKE